jgi:hypothetical protein
MPPAFAAHLPACLQSEASDVFFSVTKLFQHKDVHLRRMVYLVIKEIIPSSDEVIIITSSLMKDMNSKNDLYRANAIRVLCRIIDSQMLLQIERYLKQAVVDKSAVVASAVLAGAIHLAGQNAEVIKRWSNEVQEAITSRHPMVRAGEHQRGGRGCRGQAAGRCLVAAAPAAVLPASATAAAAAGAREPAGCANAESVPCLPCCPCPALTPQVQFQAVALMHALRANDRLAVSKLVTQLTRSNVRSPMAQCLLVRYVAQVSTTPGSQGGQADGLDWAGSCWDCWADNVLCAPGHGSRFVCCPAAAAA